MAKFKPFVANQHPTIGVEQEFHLIDPDTGELVPAVEDVIEAFGQQDDGGVARELKNCVVEAQTPVCRDIAELDDAVLSIRRRVAQACSQVGAGLAAAGTHPFSNWREQPFVDSGHYRWVAEQGGYLTDRMMAFGLHVHVGMRSPEAVLYVLHEFKRWVYPLLALSANSPYFEGHDTHLDSARLHLFQSLPRTGLLPSVESMSELEEIYTELVNAGDITRPGDMWYMLRPQPPLGTAEVRAYDLPTDPERVGILAAVTQAAMALLQDQYETGAERSRLFPEYLKENAWKAMRFGLEADIIEPETGEVLSMRDQIRRLLDRIAAKAEDLGSLGHIERAGEILSEGNEAMRQREFIGDDDPDMRGLELDIARRSVS